jgi:hypothetical protein
VLVCRSSARLAPLGLLLLASCGRCGAATPDRPAAAALPDAARTGGSDAAGVDAVVPDAARTIAPDAAGVDAEAASAYEAVDAGPSACRLVYGPAEQSFRGPAAMQATATELRLIANDDGRPRVFRVPLAPPPPASAPKVVPPKPSTFAAMRWPPCELAGRWAYCPGPGGVVNRTTLGAADTRAVARSQPSTRIAAAALGPDHALVATLDARRTTEGVMMQAFVTLDEGETQRLAEDGAGATAVRLVSRGDGAVALYLDARTAMVPVHARPVALRGHELALGGDAVVFVGGPPERGIELTPVVAEGALFALVPMSRELTEFGLAALRVADPPGDDVAPVWSLYPNGLDPAPVAAATAVRPEQAAWVARVRPAGSSAGAPRVLELGRVDAAGRFLAVSAWAPAGRITDLAILADAYGAVWLLYGDSAATWLERRVCP